MRSLHAYVIHPGQDSSSLRLWNRKRFVLVLNIPFLILLRIIMYHLDGDALQGYSVINLFYVKTV